LGLREEEEGREERGRRAICASGVKKEEVDEDEKEATMMKPYKKEMNAVLLAFAFGLKIARAVRVWSGVEVGIGRHSESFHQATKRQKTSGHDDMFGNTLPN